MSAFGKGILISATALVLTLAIIEVLFRLISGLHHAPPPKNDRPKIHFFSEKSLSTVDYLYSQEKPAGTFRIAVVGDSFAYGFGNLFDDAFPKRLERILNLNDSATKVEVLNFGMPGYSSENEINAVRQVVNRYSPDLVILEITLNDPDSKVFRRDDKKNSKGSLVVSGGIFDYWKSLAYVVSRVKNTISVYTYKRYFQSLFEDQATVKRFEAAIRKIGDAAKRHTTIVAVIFPLVTFPLDDTYPFTHAHDVIHQILASYKIASLDLLEAFRGLDPNRLQAEPWLDPHPNEIAHRIAAEAIYVWLRKHCLIPADTIVRYTARKRIGPAKLKKRGPKVCKKAEGAGKGKSPSTSSDSGAARVGLPQELAP